MSVSCLCFDTLSYNNAAACLKTIFFRAYTLCCFFADWIGHNVTVNNKRLIAFFSAVSTTRALTLTFRVLLCKPVYWIILDMPATNNNRHSAPNTKTTKVSRNSSIHKTPFCWSSAFDRLHDKHVCSTCNQIEFQHIAHETE